MLTTNETQVGRVAVLVLGPPRSGTSAVSHMLSRLGVDFGAPDDFVDPNVHTHNPIFFELRKLNELNDRILARQGIHYADFDYFHDPSVVDAALVQAFVPEIRSLVEGELSGGALIGLKDPRFVLTLPIWTAALEGFGYSLKFVLTIRAREAVVRSNAAVNGFSESHNRRIAILSEQLAALQLRGKDVIAVDYDRLVEQPVEQSQRIAVWLGINTAVDAADAAQVIAGGLRHQSADDRPSSDLYPAQEYLEERASAFARWRASLDDSGIVELVDTRRKAILQLQRDVLAAHEQKWLEGSRFIEDIERLRSHVHALEQEILACNTTKAEEAARWIAEAQNLQIRLHQAEQQALKANTEKAMEGQAFAAQIQQLQNCSREAAEDLALERERLASERARSMELESLVARNLERIAELEDSSAQEREHIGRERAQFREFEENTASNIERMTMRIRGLERRQRFAMFGGLLTLAAAAVMACAYLA